MRWLEEQKVGYNLVSTGTILWCGEEVVVYDVGSYAYDAVCQRALYKIDSVVEYLGNVSIVWEL
jgi:hypothetical protein